MRICLGLSGVLLALGAASAKPLPLAADRPAGPWALGPGERLLTTPPVVIRFGWTTVDPEDLVGGLPGLASSALLTADCDGVLELACSPRSVIPWGTVLFRIYELDLLADLRRAEQAAARLGDAPVIIAPRDFPTPTRRAVAPPPPMPMATAPAAPERRIAAVPIDPPLVRLPPTQAAPEAAAQPPAASASSAPERRAGSTRERLAAASARLEAAESRVSQMAALAEAAAADAQASESACAPLRDDVAARERLAEAGVIARNDVKAARERLADAEAASAAAQRRLEEAQAALTAAQQERTAALAGVDVARSAPTPAPPAAAASPPPQPPQPRREAQTSRPREMPMPTDALPDLRDESPEIAFPSPGPALAPGVAELPPVPRESFRLAPPQDVPGLNGWSPLPLPEGVDALAEQRWREATAPTQCVVTRAFFPQGARVLKGMPVMEVRATSAARLRVEIAEPYVGFCEPGRRVEVAFPTAGAVFRGWIARAEPTRSPRPPGARVEIVLTEVAGGSSSVYQDLEWLALSSLELPRARAPLSYRPDSPAQRSPADVESLFPLGPVGTEQAASPRAPDDGRLSGSAVLVSSQRPQSFAADDPVAATKLRRLQEWRNSFLEGMRTTVFPETGLTLTYPRGGEIARAVERMATRRVSHVPNRCAGTLAEALGWGLGDAAMWARRLPERGYERRRDGVARPGDIVVWPFTYGLGRSQHVGIAVAQGHTMMLLSNEGGTLGTSPLTGGYLAFHKPTPEASTADQTPQQ